MKVNFKNIFGAVILCAMLSLGALTFFGETAHAGIYIPPGGLEPFLTSDSIPTAGGPVGGTTSSTAASQSEIELAGLFETILKVLYLLLWPLLAIAGASLDNTLVYGDIFYLDKALRQFWQMIRTFANFALGFIFIASIFISFVGAEKKFEKISVKTIIKKLFLAGVLINMSWFLVAALLDLSTILVFNLGALPLHVIRQDVENNEGLGKARYLTTHSFYNQDSSINTQRDQLEHSVIYSCPGGPADDFVGPSQFPAQKTYYLPCWIENGRFVDTDSLDENNSWNAYKQQHIDARKEIGNGDIEGNISDQYCVRGYDLIELVPGGQFTPEIVPALRDNAQQELESKNCSTIDRLIEKAQGMTGPMYTLYATILHMGEVGLTINNKTDVEKGLEFLMRVMVALALFLPLLALAVVLVMRAVILWLVIAFSPLLVLVYVFGFKMAGGEKSELKSVLGLIFLPVFAVFAVSISILFLSLIGRIELIDSTDTCKVDTFSRLTGAEVSCPQDNQKCYKLFNITEICFTESQRTTGANIISTLTWLTINFFGIALMRTIIFFALKSNKITGAIAGKIEAFGKGLAGSATIIPLPASLGGATSLGALNRSAAHLKGVPDAMATQQYNQGLGEYIESQFAVKDAKSKEKALAEKVAQAKTQPVTFSPSSDFVLPDDTNHAQYKSIGPALGMASGKKYDQAKSMTFEDAYSDPKTVGYMQQNNLYTTDTWVKNDGNVGSSKKAELARNWESKLASMGKSLGRDTANPNTTWYVLGDYVTKFPRGNNTKGILATNEDVANTHIAATPTKKEHWDTFKSFFDNNAGIKDNPEFIAAFPQYMNFLNGITGSATRVDDKTDPANPKTHTVTVVKDAANKVTGFQIT